MAKHADPDILTLVAAVFARRRALEGAGADPSKLMWTLAEVLCDGQLLPTSAVGAAALRLIAIASAASPEKVWEEVGRARNEDEWGTCNDHHYVTRLEADVLDARVRRSVFDADITPPELSITDYAGEVRCVVATIETATGITIPDDLRGVVTTGVAGVASIRRSSHSRHPHDDQLAYMRGESGHRTDGVPLREFLVAEHGVAPYVGLCVSHLLLGTAGRDGDIPGSSSALAVALTGATVSDAVACAWASLIALAVVDPGSALDKAGRDVVGKRAARQCARARQARATAASTASPEPAPLGLIGV